MVTFQIRKKKSSYLCVCERRYVNSLDIVKYIKRQTPLFLDQHANTDLKTVNY